VNRREFSRLISAGAALTAAGPALPQSESTPTVYFVDGYHGGVRGHMPPGSWRDILNVMREIPQWKLCLDIEPESWDVFAPRRSAGVF
jgi:alpha-mannosidase